jgi:hypothetical protein
MRQELQQMLTLGVFTPVQWEALPNSQRLAAIRSSLFIKHKYAPNGKFVKCKARLVAGGNTQDKSLYANISSPTATPAATLFVGGDAAKHGKSVASMDIGAAYLNAEMAPTGVTVHMIIDPRLTAILVDLDPSYATYVRKDGSVCVVLVRALYGTVEAARLWYNLICKHLTDYGFVKNRFDRCVLNKTLEDGTRVTIVLYVDDLLVTCVRPGPIDDLRKYLESIFPEVTFHSGKKIDYVGMTLDFETRPGAMLVTMQHSIDDILTTSKIASNKPSPATEDLFVVTESPKLNDKDEGWYRKFVAKCLYLAKRVRPDILLAVGFLTTRAQFCTMEDNDKLLRVLSYLRSTPDRGTVIEFGESPRTRSYIDAAYAIHGRDGKSHTGGVLMFGKGGPLHVTSVKQSVVAKSSTEAELIAFSDVGSEVVCLRNFSIDQGYPPAPAIIYQDNNSAMALAINGAPCSKRSRHIEIRHFWMKEKIDDGSFEITRCPTAEMWANVLTKPCFGTQLAKEIHGITNWPM